MKENEGTVRGVCHERWKEYSRAASSGGTGWYSMESKWNSIWNGSSMERLAIPTPVRFHVESMELPNGIPPSATTGCKYHNRLLCFLSYFLSFP